MEELIRGIFLTAWELIQKLWLPSIIVVGMVISLILPNKK